MTALPNLKHLPYGGAQAVPDTRSLQHVAEIVAHCARYMDDIDIQHLFLEQYLAWIKSTKRNTWIGLDDFAVAAVSNGTSESFDKFYLKNHPRRFRCFRGEYMYHAASWRNYFPNWCWIEDSDIDTGDAVVLSWPFSDTGGTHDSTQDLLDQCDRLGVPVLIDCAFFGCCAGLEFDLAHECITDVTFSLSKTYPVAHARIGMRLTRTDDDDSLLVHHKTGYTNRLAAGIGLAILQHHSPDSNADRWQSKQIELCRTLKITPSPTVLFGIDTNGLYPQYNRGNMTNRLCLARRLADHD